MILKLLVALLVISNIIQWRCITGIIHDILKLERKMQYEKLKLNYDDLCQVVEDIADSIGQVKERDIL